MDLYEYHMFIRKTTYADLDTVMAIYDQARTYMIDNGNPSQWAEGHPKRSLLEEDIKEGVSYVVLGEDGIIHGVFAFIIGEDPTYKVIENGGWLNEHIYGTIHRIAGDGKVKGISKACFDFCKTRISDLRCDTHHDNHTMQQVMIKNGFLPCGIIHVEDGSPRLAYQFSRNP